MIWGQVGHRWKATQEVGLERLRMGDAAVALYGSAAATWVAEPIAESIEIRGVNARMN